MVVVLMGPAGAGKTTVGLALAGQLGWMFVDADDHHLPASLAKIAAGIPLTDDDRDPWLDRLHGLVGRAVDRRESLVLACSALAHRHRARIAGSLRGVRFVYLKASAAALRERLDHRHGHIAKAALLDSQLATLEEPGDGAVTLDATLDVDTLVGHVRFDLGL